MKRSALASALNLAIPDLLDHGVDVATMERCVEQANANHALTVWMQLARLLGPVSKNGEATPEEKNVERVWLATGAKLKDLFAAKPKRENREWKNTVETCVTREDFLSLFRALGLEKEQWKSHGWMGSMSRKSAEEGGVGYHMGAISEVIRHDPRWEGYESFVVWMGEAEESMASRVRGCETQADFMRLFAEIGIPEGKWRSGHWLVYKAKLPKEKGGIGRAMSGLKISLQKKFGGYQRFVSWMDGTTYVETTPLTVRLAACTDPAQVKTFFAEHGVPGEKWRELEWMIKGSPKTVEEGGIDKSMLGIVKAVYEDERWGRSYKQFVAWMDGKDKPDTSMAERVRACATQEDYEALFDSIGVPLGERFKTTWYHERSPLPVDQGGVGKFMGHVVGYIQEKFGSWKEFLTFMNKERVTPQWADTIAACLTREDFLTFFASLGIPDRKWQNYTWLNVTAALPVDQGGIGRSMSGMRSGLSNDPRFGGSFLKFVAWMEGADIDDEKLLERLASCVTKEDFKTFLERDFGASTQQWQTMGWLNDTAHLPVEQGGIGRYGASVFRALCKQRKENKYDEFLKWMGLSVSRKNRKVVEKKKRLPDHFYRDKVAACSTREEFEAMLTEAGVPRERWTQAAWMFDQAHLPPEQGGIGKRLSRLAIALREDERFPSGFRDYYAFMENRPLSVNVKERFAACETRDDYKQLLRDIRLPEEACEDCSNLERFAKERADEFPGVWTFIRLAAERFRTYGKFSQWMTKREPDTYGNRAEKCVTPADFLAWFAELGVPDGAWRKKNWFIQEAKLPPHEGGIGKSMAGLPNAIQLDERFEEHSWEQFIAFMDGVPLPPPVMTKRMENVQTREQYLAFFASIGIPGDNWRSSNWLERVALLPPEQGGVGKSFQSVAKLVRRRFESFPGFVAWMDNREALAPRQEIEKLVTQADFLAFFAACGVPGTLWRNSRWMTIQSIKPVEEGGIGRSMSGFYNLIRERFGIFKQFIAWMDGKEKPEPNMPERIASMKTPEEFRAFFAAQGVPGEKWRSSLWLGKKCMLPPEQGGIGKNLSSMVGPIAKDPRFGGYKEFVAWMDGKDAKPYLKERIASMKTPAAFLAYFAELGVPGDRWKKIWWMRSESKKPVAEGGIGKSLGGLSQTIVQDERFGGYRRFVEWMGGVPLNGIESDEQAATLLRTEAARFDVSVDQLLSAESIQRYRWQSHVLNAVVEYMRTRQAP